MPDAKPTTGAKDLWRVLKASPALMVTVAIGLVVILYLVYRNSQANSAGTNTAQGMSLQPPLYSQPVVIEPTLSGLGSPTGSNPSAPTSGTPGYPMFPAGSTYSPGGNGRQWIKTPDGRTYLLTGTASGYTALFPNGLIVQKTPHGSYIARPPNTQAWTILVP